MWETRYTIYIVVSKDGDVEMAQVKKSVKVSPKIYIDSEIDEICFGPLDDGESYLILGCEGPEPEMLLVTRDEFGRHAEFSTNDPQDFDGFSLLFPREKWPTAIFAGKKFPEALRTPPPELEAWFQENCDDLDE